MSKVAEQALAALASVGFDLFKHLGHHTLPPAIFVTARAEEVGRIERTPLAPKALGETITTPASRHRAQ